MRKSLILVALLGGAAVPTAAIAAVPPPPQAREVPPEFGTATSSMLQGLACPNSTSCVAVGASLDAQGNTTATGANTNAFGAWQETELPFNAESDYDSISCVAAFQCEGVGTDTVPSSSLYGGKTFESGDVLSYSDSAWGGSMIGLPINADLGEAGATKVTLDSISCPTAGDCVAVGSYTASDATVEAMTVTQVGQFWSQRATELSLPQNASVAAQNADLHSVACSSLGNCQAAGSYTDTSGTLEPMVATEANGVWGAAVAIGFPGNATGAAVLSSLACTSTGNCQAVGYYTTASAGQQPWATTESDGIWGTPSELSLPSDASTVEPSTSLDSVACSSLGNCEAVGSYTDSLGDQLPLAETQTSGSWGLTAGGVTLPPNASTTPGVQKSNLTAVVCSAATSCLAIGDFTERNAITEAMRVALDPVQTGSLSIRSVKLLGDRLSASVACQGRSGQACVGRVTLGAVEHLNGNRITAVSAAVKSTQPITFGSRIYSLREGSRVTLVIPLSTTGRGLLIRFGTLRTALTASATGTRRPVIRTVVFSASQPKPHK